MRTATANAKRLINIISLEVLKANRRVHDEHIGHTQVAGCVLEGLYAKAKKDVDLKTFLNTMAFIPNVEDEDPSLPWAEDRRVTRQNVVTDGEDEAFMGGGTATVTGDTTVDIDLPLRPYTVRVLDLQDQPVVGA